MAARAFGRPAPAAAPIGGMNARDPLRGMPKGDLIVGQNVICRTDGLHQRNGYTVRNTGLESSFTALMRAGDAYFAATASHIYDITAEGAATSVVSGLTGGRWSWDTFANGAGVGLIATNGTDGPRYYLNGAWGTCTITGVDPAALNSVAVHGRRAFFNEDGEFRLWYLGVNAVHGVARQIELRHLFVKGGEVAAIGSLSLDGGKSKENRFVVVTTNGEMAVFAGFDPDNAATWMLAGVYEVPRPIGRDCLAKYGASLIYLSAVGLSEVPNIIDQAKSDAQPAELTAKIYNAYIAALDTAEASGDPYPWTFDMTSAASTLDHTSGSWTFDFDSDASPGVEESWNVCDSDSEWLLIVNRGAKQYIYDPQSHGWTEWTGLTATWWLDTSRELWFATSSGTVCKYTGTTDNGSAIDSLIVEAYERMSGRIDRRNRVKPLFAASPSYRPRVKFIFDFEAAPTAYTATTQAYQDLAQEVSGRGRDGAFVCAFKSITGAHYIGRDAVIEGGWRP